MPLYFAQFVIAEENLWFSNGDTSKLLRTTTSHRVDTQLFSASDAEKAYVRAIEMIEGLSDAHCDGPGDRTNFKCLGIHDLDAVFLADRSLAGSLEEPYGVDIGAVHINDEVPVVSSREALSVFAKRAA